MKKYNFMANKKTAYIIAAVIIVVGIVSFIVRGFNLDIDFAGGNEISVDIGVEVTKDVQNDIRAELTKGEGKDQIIKDNQISSIAKSGSNSNQVIIRTVKLNNETMDKIFEALKTKYNLTAETPDSIESVGSTISSGTRTTAFFSAFIAIVLILVYITFRFQFTSGLASIACLAFNIFTMLSFYSLFQIPINSNVIAACLTILGYSINSTIVIFDRVRENIKKYKVSFEENANAASQQTFTRTLNSTITTLITIGMIYILGVEAIRYFALPLIVGIVAGFFSSVFMSCPIWDFFNKTLKIEERKAKKKAAKNQKAVKAK